MRTNIIIDDELMTDVLKLTGIKSKREAVEQGLRILLALKQQEKIKQFKGALKWEGDLEQMRNEQ
jgi:Arc/MetJ family transcription regulator